VPQKCVNGLMRSSYYVTYPFLCTLLFFRNFIEVSSQLHAKQCSRSVDTVPQPSLVTVGGRQAGGADIMCSVMKN
jgi:hypothetical protein